MNRIILMMIVMTVGASFSDPAVPVPKGSGTVVGSGLPTWGLDIDISRGRPSWVGEQRLVITPTVTADGYYIPNDMQDAWRELDKMLPTAFVDDRVPHSSEAECSDDRIGRGIETHLSLVNYLRYAWLGDKRSRFLIYFSNHLDLSFGNVSPEAKQKFDSETASLLADLTLCSYYRWKSTGRSPNFQALFDQAQLEISLTKKNLREGRPVR